MNKRRKSIAIALSCAMLAGTALTTAAIPGSNTPFSITVNAADIVDSGSCGENLTYTIDNEGTLTISGTGEMYNYGYGESPFNTEIETVIIEDGVTTIGDCAFGGCEVLTNINIPDSVTSIGDYAFEECSSLSTITIPDSVTSIGGGAFAGTLWYENQPDGLVYAGKVAYKYNGEMPENTLITLEEGTTGIADNAFWACTSLTSINIPDSVTSIGKNAFATCSSLTDITIPGSVTSIGESAFFDCTSLTDITIPDSVTSIGGLAFADCTSLTSINIPDSVTSIGLYAFYNCTSLTSITIPDSVTGIEDRALGYNWDSDSWEDVKQPGFTIYGYTGSEAERYANDNGFEFISLGEVPVPVVKTGDVTAEACPLRFLNSP